MKIRETNTTKMKRGNWGKWLCCCFDVFDLIVLWIYGDDDEEIMNFCLLWFYLFLYYLPFLFEKGCHPPGHRRVHNLIALNWGKKWENLNWKLRSIQFRNHIFQHFVMVWKVCKLILILFSDDKGYTKRVISKWLMNYLIIFCLLYIIG